MLKNKSRWPTISAMSKIPTMRIHISFRSFVYLILAVAATWFVIKISDILLLIFVSALFAAALEPSVKSLQKLKIPRWLAVAVIYVIFLGLITLLVYLFIPALVHQVETISKHWPGYRDRLNGMIAGQPLLENIGHQINNAISGDSSKITSSITSTTFSVLSGVVGFITFLVLTFYMLVSGKKIGYSVVELIPDQKLQKRILTLGMGISQKLGHWLRGQAFLCFIIFILALIGLLILRVDFALTLAFIAGIMEAVPLVGAYLGAIPAIIVALADSPEKALAVGIMFLVIQQFEGHVIVPQVMRRALGIPPIIVLIAVMIGGKLLGFIGVLLALPVAAAASIVISDVIGTHNSKSTSTADTGVE